MSLGFLVFFFFFFQAEDGIRDLVRSRGLGDVYKRQLLHLGQRLSAIYPPHIRHSAVCSVSPSYRLPVEPHPWMPVHRGPSRQFGSLFGPAVLDGCNAAKIKPSTRLYWCALAFSASANLSCWLLEIYPPLACHLCAIYAPLMRHSRGRNARLSSRPSAPLHRR